MTPCDDRKSASGTTRPAASFFAGTCLRLMPLGRLVRAAGGGDGTAVEPSTASLPVASSASASVSPFRAGEAQHDGSPTTPPRSRLAWDACADWRRKAQPARPTRMIGAYATRASQRSVRVIRRCRINQVGGPACSLRAHRGCAERGNGASEHLDPLQGARDGEAAWHSGGLKESASALCADDVATRQRER